MASDEVPDPVVLTTSVDVSGFVESVTTPLVVLMISVDVLEVALSVGVESELDVVVSVPLFDPVEVVTAGFDVVPSTPGSFVVLDLGVVPSAPEVVVPSGLPVVAINSVVDPELDVVVLVPSSEEVVTADLDVVPSTPGFVVVFDFDVVPSTPEVVVASGFPVVEIDIVVDPLVSVETRAVLDTSSVVVSYTDVLVVLDWLFFFVEVVDAFSTSWLVVSKSVDVSVIVVVVTRMVVLVEASDPGADVLSRVPVVVVLDPFVVSIILPG